MSKLSISLERAVVTTVNEIEKTVNRKSWQTRCESELFQELVATILGSQVKFETAQYYTKRLVESGLLTIIQNQRNLNTIEKEIFTLLNTRPNSNTNSSFNTVTSYRYPRTKANYIRRTAESLYFSGDTITGLLNRCHDARNARKSIMSSTIGIGPKQSSLFLRNIGFTNELAILDKHVMNYLHILNIASPKQLDVALLNRYETIENKLVDYARFLDSKLDSLDMAIWIVMRVYSREYKKWEW